MTRIGFAITDPLGGGAYYRGNLPARVLRERGHEVVVGDQVRYGDTEWRLGIDLLEGAVSNPQGLTGERFTDDAGGAVETFIPDVLVVTAGWSLIVDDVLTVGRQAGAGSLGRNPDQVLVVDYDDGLDAPPDNAGFRPDQVARKVQSALLADRLTASTPKVAKDLAAIPRPTNVARNAIDPALYADVAAQNEHRLANAHEDDPLVLGYRGPLPWHQADVESLRGVAQSLVELGCRFLHVGARSTDKRTFAEVLGISPELVEMRLQVPFAQYPDQLLGADVGIVPWARRPWSTYKSNIGGLEWNAAAVPWISTDQPEYRKLSGTSVVSGLFGWGSRLRELRDPDAREALLERQLAAARGLDVRERASSVGASWERALGLA